MAVFEATYNGTCYNYLVPEAHLPMMTGACATQTLHTTRARQQTDVSDRMPTLIHVNTNAVDHPEFKEQAAKIEEARRRKLSGISEMIRQSKANGEAAHEWELRAIEVAHAVELGGLKDELRRGLERARISAELAVRSAGAEAAAANAAAASAINPPALADAATSPQPPPSKGSADDATAALPAAQAVVGAASAPILEVLGATVTSASQAAAAAERLRLDDVTAELQEHPLVRARRKRARGEQGLGPAATGAGSLDGGGGGGGVGGVGASFSGSGASLGRMPSGPSMDSSSAGGGLSRSSATAGSGSSGSALEGIAEEEEEGEGEEESEGLEFLGSDDTDDAPDDAAAGGYRDIVDIFQERLLRTERPRPAQRKKRRRKWGRGRPWTS